MADASKDADMPKFDHVFRPMVTFSHFMAYELLARENLSEAALADVRRRRKGFLDADEKLAGAAFMIKMKSQPVNLMVTVLDADEASAMGATLSQVEAVAGAQEVAKMLAITDMVIKRWHKDFPAERINSKLNKDKWMLLCNPDSKSGMGFRGLTIATDEPDSDDESDSGDESDENPDENPEDGPEKSPEENPEDAPKESPE